MILDERKIKILSAIINDYIAMAEPVGSRTIARRYKIGISPATIRNEMADLEELGYLFQPHTSAGRVPSNKGYRFYVDFLMPQKPLARDEKNLIKQVFKKRISEIEDLIEEAAKVIAKLTSYTAIFLGPELETSKLKYIQITRIDEEKGIILIVTNYGNISHHIIDVPSTLTDSDLETVSNILNENLIGKTLSEISNDVIQKVKKDMIKYEEILNVFLDILQESLSDSKDSSMIISSGSSNMLGLPEFNDIEKAKKYLDLLEQHELILETLRYIAKPNSISVCIGNENPLDEFQELSVITADFFSQGKSLGVCGIIGPTRMEYSKVVAILKDVMEYLNRTISKLL